jgi:hypothetical protein
LGLLYRSFLTLHSSAAVTNIGTTGLRHIVNGVGGTRGLQDRLNKGSTEPGRFPFTSFGTEFGKDFSKYSDIHGAMTWAPPKVSLSDRISQQQSKTLESEFQRGGGTKFGKDTEGKTGRKAGSEAARERECVCWWKIHVVMLRQKVQECD